MALDKHYVDLIANLEKDNKELRNQGKRMKGYLDDACEELTWYKETNKTLLDANEVLREGKLIPVDTPVCQDGKYFHDEELSYSVAYISIALVLSVSVFCFTVYKIASMIGF